MSTTRTRRKTTAKPVKARPVEKLHDYKRTIESAQVVATINKDEKGKPKLPAGLGGIRFNVAEGEALSTVYIDQHIWAKLGKPNEVTVTVSVA